MKSILLTAIVISATACSKNKETTITKTEIVSSKNSNDSILGKKLIENDYLKYADATKSDSLKKEIAESFMIYDEETYKFAHIDAEELAEYNFDSFVPQLNKMLAKRNISLSIKTADDYEKTNNIFINNEKVNLYTPKELKYGNFWKVASKNFFGKLNDILKVGHSEEKFYLIYGGNDLAVLLLTQKQFEIIKEKYKTSPQDIPYVP